MKPALILDAHWRRVDELFDPDTLIALREAFDVVWAKDEPLPDDVLIDALPRTTVLVTATQKVDRSFLDKAPLLKVVIEVSGAFPDTIDYEACASRGIEVLSCAAGFQESVAEMALAMTLAGARGLVREHELFRHGEEFWLDDREGRDFTVFGAQIGFVGFGAIARATHKLLIPFAPDVCVYDPWLPAEAAEKAGVTQKPLVDVMSQSQVVYLAAAPTRENRAMIGADLLNAMAPGALLVLISRAHLIDFDALTSVLMTGRISAAVDVFPQEPLASDHPIRKLPNVILSPHRAAAVPGGRQLIGRMILADVMRIMDGKIPIDLQRASTANIAQIIGVDDAAQVASMAEQRS